MVIAMDYDTELPAFIAVPSTVLRTMHSEIMNIVGEDMADAVLYRLGYLSGRELMSKLGLNQDTKELQKELPALWAEVGLGRITKVHGATGGIEIDMAEVMESTGEACSFTRGYLSGFVSALTKRVYYGEVLSHNGSKYRFLLHSEGGVANE